MLCNLHLTTVWAVDVLLSRLHLSRDTVQYLKLEVPRTFRSYFTVGCCANRKSKEPDDARMIYNVRRQEISAQMVALSNCSTAREGSYELRSHFSSQDNADC